MKQGLRVALTLAGLVVVLGYCYHFSTFSYPIPQEHRHAWQVINQTMYDGQLTEHDISVIEQIAQANEVGPYRVVMTIRYMATSPTSTYGEGEESIKETGRKIDAIESAILFHPGVLQKFATLPTPEAGWLLAASLFPESKPEYISAQLAYVKSMTEAENRSEQEFIEKFQ